MIFDRLSNCEQYIKMNEKFKLAFDFLNKTDLNSTEYTNALVEKILFNQTGNVIDSAAIPSFDIAYE